MDETRLNDSPIHRYYLYMFTNNNSEYLSDHDDSFRSSPFPLRIRSPIDMYPSIRGTFLVSEHLWLLYGLRPTLDINDMTFIGIFDSHSEAMEHNKLGDSIIGPIKYLRTTMNEPIPMGDHPFPLPRFSTGIERPEFVQDLDLKCDDEFFLDQYMWVVYKTANNSFGFDATTSIVRSNTIEVIGLFATREDAMSNMTEDTIVRGPIKRYRRNKDFTSIKSYPIDNRAL